MNKIEPKRLTETISYEHKGIKVLVHVDHMNAKVSIVERDLADRFIPKKWVFIERGLEYMQGWQNILDAMKYAVGEATKLLEKDHAEASAFQDRMIAEVSKEAIKNNKRKSNIKK